METETKQSKTIDVATLVGILAAFGLVFYAIHLDGSVLAFFDLRALFIVGGGTLGATMVNFSLADFGRTFGLLNTAFFPSRSPLHDRIARILQFARLYRGEKSPRIQQEVDQEYDSFFHQALSLMVDGQKEEEIRKIMGIELSFLEDRHRRGAHLFQTMGTIAPAMGLIGTLIGLVQMLQRLSDPESIGPAMAVALLTTFYGAVLAQLIFFPLAGKLRARSEEEFQLKELTIEGVAAIAEGINPRLIELRLLGFLPPAQRYSEYE